MQNSMLMFQPIHAFNTLAQFVKIVMILAILAKVLSIMTVLVVQDHCISKIINVQLLAPQELIQIHKPIIIYARIAIVLASAALQAVIKVVLVVVLQIIQILIIAVNQLALIITMVKISQVEFAVHVQLIAQSAQGLILTNALIVIQDIFYIKIHAVIYVQLIIFKISPLELAIFVTLLAKIVMVNTTTNALTALQVYFLIMLLKLVNLFVQQNAQIAISVILQQLQMYAKAVIKVVLIVIAINVLFQIYALHVNNLTIQLEQNAQVVSLDFMETQQLSFVNLVMFHVLRVQEEHPQTVLLVLLIIFYIYSMGCKVNVQVFVLRLLLFLGKIACVLASVAPQLMEMLKIPRGYVKIVIQNVGYVLAQALILAQNAILGFIYIIAPVQVHVQMGLIKIHLIKNVMPVTNIVEHAMVLQNQIAQLVLLLYLEQVLLVFQAVQMANLEILQQEHVAPHAMMDIIKILQIEFANNVIRNVKLAKVHNHHTVQFAETLIT
ncbi:transmembrane protein, putative (macronuclear) [Tetrahymena thermophila SB210]|uniref:Transmembrane protein, putative n=1 Tax=Tetrahymena thermophila (strain SB210) TaxID=312017 RepID=W7XIS5_TETTS|nr:transmembrane protein, putative [Tetrahymena thermophila SB210]EWS73574.1 transmembrane protein, putative [Tetrahymena thermophila SB210]|eukprot:XP_012653897.1 transmembrane protein, putative [Tetrahymena thermophila SB210]